MANHQVIVRMVIPNELISKNQGQALSVPGVLEFAAECRRILERSIWELFTKTGYEVRTVKVRTSLRDSTCTITLGAHCTEEGCKAVRLYLVQVISNALQTLFKPHINQ